MPDLLTGCLILLTVAALVMAAAAVWLARTARIRLYEIQAMMGKLQTDTSLLIGELRVLAQSADQSLQYVNHGLSTIDERLQSRSQLRGRVASMLELAEAGWTAWEYWQKRRSDSGAGENTTGRKEQQSTTEGSNS
ncbi:hypothetical protein [Paenibacillus daejeonensis]|uniref:hypothetical protein n=1 Tax=Paenibacillus daejeonensis TaxID=135193 RepID=UPI0003800E31|nr:hypothetical protein [Paenibacillus daejeonensis]